MQTKKNKPKYTKQDSLSFNKYEELLATHGGNISSKFPQQFLDDYAKFKGGKKTKDRASSRVDPKVIKESVPGYSDKRKQELSDFLVNKSSAYEGLKSEFDKDYKKFQADEARYGDIISSIDVLQSEWNAREKGDWHPRTWFNMYEKGSSMDLLRDELDALRGERSDLKDRLYGEGGRGWDKGERGRILNRKGGLEKMSKSLLKKQEEFDVLQNLELESKGY
tara:strand:- start:2 stop:667 length:666 start_codon:yes stop_codon:yes gene_type:complete